MIYHIIYRIISYPIYHIIYVYIVPLLHLSAFVACSRAIFTFTLHPVLSFNQMHCSSQYHRPTVGEVQRISITF
jgi:hypothetical protein